MKQMKKYLFRLVAFLGLTITPFIASAEEVSLGESISKFLNDTGFARLVEGNWSVSYTHLTLPTICSV